MCLCDSGASICRRIDFDEYSDQDLKMKVFPRFVRCCIQSDVFDFDEDSSGSEDFDWKVQSRKLYFLTMRPLTDPETKTLFDKLANYTGRSLTNLITPPSTGSNPSDRYVFRLQDSRVYYLPLSLANLATSVARDNLLSIGTCLGKYTKTGKFRLHITALDIIAPHARYKVWIKPNGEMPFLYGGNILKAHVGRWSEDCPEHQGVVVYSMDDTPLVSESEALCEKKMPRVLLIHTQGFGVTARSTAETRRLEPTAITCFRQADVGEYLREVGCSPHHRPN